MSNCDSYLQSVENRLNELCTVSDLIRVGIYRSAQQASYARRSGIGPEFIIMPHKRVMYPKKAVIAYLRDCITVTKRFTQKESNEATKQDN